MKNQMLMLFVAKLGIIGIQESYLSLIWFHLRGNNNKSKSLCKRVVQVVTSQLFQEICLKSKNGLQRSKVQLVPITGSIYGI